MNPLMGRESTYKGTQAAKVDFHSGLLGLMDQMEGFVGTAVFLSQAASTRILWSVSNSACPYQQQQLEVLHGYRPALCLSSLWRRLLVGQRAPPRLHLICPYCSSHSVLCLSVCVYMCACIWVRVCLCNSPMFLTILACGLFYPWVANHVGLDLKSLEHTRESK